MIVQAVMILVALLLLWGRALWAPVAMESGDHPAVLYGLVSGWLMPLPRLAVVIAMLLVLAEGVILNLLLASVNLVSQNSLLPTLLYIIAMSAGAESLTPTILVNAVCIIGMHYLLLRGTLLTIPAEKICGATLMIGIASLFYQPVVVLIFSYLLIAANYRLYNWKDWCLMILGFAIPYVLLVVVLYMTDGLAAWWDDTVACFAMPLLQLGHTDGLGTIAAILLATVLLWGLMTVLSHIGERPVLWQKNATTVILFTIGGLGIMIFSPLLPLQTACLAIPFSFVVYRLLASATEKSNGLGRRRKQHLWIYDLLLIVILIAAFVC